MCNDAFPEQPFDFLLVNVKKLTVYLFKVAYSCLHRARSIKNEMRL